MLTLFFTTDINGSEQCWRKLINVGALFQVDILIVSGNLIGSSLQPVVKIKNDLWTSEFMGESFQLRSRNELEELEKKIRARGLYPCRVSPEEAEVLSGSQSVWDQLFEEAVSNSLDRWLDLAERKIRAEGRRFCLMSGNEDPLFVDALIKKSTSVEWVQRRVISLDDSHAMISEACSNPASDQGSREVEEDELYEILTSQVDTLDRIPNAVFNIHLPPAAADAGPARQSNRELPGSDSLTHGSTAVRRLIETYQPLLSLHRQQNYYGHNRFNTIGRTLCLFPGSSCSEGFLSGFLITLDSSGILDFQPVTG